MNLAQILIKPVITEKSLAASKLNCYTFIVDRRATKHQIKQAFKTYFNVDVINISTLTNKGEAKRTGRRRLPTQTTPTKKAIVEVKAGQSIKAFEA